MDPRTTTTTTTTQSIYDENTAATTDYSAPVEYSNTYSNNKTWRDDDVIQVFDHDNERLQQQESNIAHAKDGSCAGLLGLLLGLITGLYVESALLPKGEGNFGVSFGVFLLAFIVIPFATAYLFYRLARWYGKKKTPHGQIKFSEYHTALTNSGIRHVVKPGSIRNLPARGENHELRIPYSDIITVEIPNEGSSSADVLIKAVDHYVHYDTAATEPNNEDRGRSFLITELKNPADFRARVMALKETSMGSSRTVPRLNVDGEDESNHSPSAIRNEIV